MSIIFKFFITIILIDIICSNAQKNDINSNKNSAHPKTDVFANLDSIPSNSSVGKENDSDFEDENLLSFNDKNVNRTAVRDINDSDVDENNGNKDLIDSSESSGDSEPDSDPSEPETNGQTDKETNFQSQAFGNWIHFKNDKSFILINKLVTEREAERICKSLDMHSDTSLAIMQSSEEQYFVNYYLFRLLKCIHNVWIGVKKDHFDHKFHEINGIPVKFTNWGHGSPSGRGQCVQLRSTYNVFDDMRDAIGGKWEDVRCDKKNYVLCQKRQGWSQSQIQRLLIDLKKEIDSMKRIKDIVPKGFVYVHYHHQYAPEQMWPWYRWKEITSEYSDLFFRVHGPHTAPFGTIQESDSPRLIGVKSFGNLANVFGQAHEIDIKADNMWSEIASGGTFNGMGMAFKVSKGEVRPINACIRIWKRI